jgi:RIO kinase 1
LDYVKQCEADIVNMSFLQHPSMGSEPPADKLYNQPMLGFVQARKNTCDDEMQQEQSPQNTVEETLDLQKKVDPKMGPEERKAARKENKNKAKEQKRKALEKKAEKKRDKMAKAKCKK